MDEKRTSHLKYWYVCVIFTVAAMVCLRPVKAGAAWTDVDLSGTGMGSNIIFSVWGSGTDNVYAGGFGGKLVQWNGTAWADVDLSGTAMGTTLIYTLWGSGADNVYAGGFTGKLVQWNGTAWANVSLAGTALNGTHIYALWGSGANDVYVGGESSTLVRWNGTAWANVNLGTASLAGGYITAIWGSGADNVYVGGNTGKMVHWNGTAWANIDLSGTAMNGKAIYSVWGSGADNVYVGGSSGKMAHWNGTVWASVDLSGTAVGSSGAKIYAVWGSGADDVYAGADGGKMVHWNGTTWADVDLSGTTMGTNTVRTVWGSGADNVYAGGVGGKLIHYVPSSDAASAQGSSSQDDGTISTNLTNPGTLKDKKVTPSGVIKGGKVGGTIENQGLVRDVEIISGGMVSGGSLGGDILNNGTVENGTILAGATITGGELQGDIVNNGTISDLTILGGTTVSGGTVSGTLVNLGTLADPSVASGAQVTGGVLTGTVTNQGTLTDVTLSDGTSVSGGVIGGTIDSSGTITGATLLPGAVVTGGAVDGQIAGDPSDPPLISAQICGTALLQDVILGEGSSFSIKGSCFGYGTQFETFAMIPNQMQITPMSTKPVTGLDYLHLFEIVDLGIKPVAESAASLLDDMNALGQVAFNSLSSGSQAFSQQSGTGSIEFDTGAETGIYQPIHIRQISPATATPGITTKDNGAVVVVTYNYQEILLTPMAHQPDQLFNLMVSSGACYNGVSYDAGTFTALMGLDTFFLVKFKPAAVSSPMLQAAGTASPSDPSFEQSPNPNVPGVSLFSMIFSENGEYRQQVLYPASADESALRKALSAIPGKEGDVSINHDGTIQVVINGTTYNGLLDYTVQIGDSSAAGSIASFADAGDLNGDGTGDLLVNYPDGSAQFMYLFQ